MKQLQGLAITVATLLLNTAAANAGLFGIHSTVDVGAGQGAAGAYAHVESDGPAFRAVYKNDSLEDSEGHTIAPVYAWASARTSVFADTLLGASATAYSNNQISPAPSGQALAFAAWHDIAFVSAGTPPEFLTLHFEVLAGLDGQGSASAGGMSVYGGVSAGQQRLGSIARNGPGYDSTEPHEPFFEISGFETIEYIDGIFHGTVKFDVPYDPTLGGFEWGVSLSTGAQAVLPYLDGQPSITRVTAMQGVALTQITGPDGIPVSVTFDSVLSFDDPQSGDFDLDGDVDGRDFVLWQRGDSPRPLTAQDLELWREQYGTAPLAGVAMPEPASLLLVAALAPMILRRSVVAFNSQHVLGLTVYMCGNPDFLEKMNIQCL